MDSLGSLEYMKALDRKRLLLTFRHCSMWSMEAIMEIESIVTTSPKEEIAAL
jgi:hypothetical protein